MKAPAVQWYFGDWLRCAELRLCSLEARGLWIEMLGFMHQATPYGHLIFEGKAVDAKRLANMVGGGSTPAKVASLLKELGENGVYSRGDEGVIYCRRMVKDQLKREAWRAEKEDQRRKDEKKPGQPPDKHPDNGGLSGQCPPDLHSAVLLSSPRGNGGDENISENPDPVDNPSGHSPGKSKPKANGTGWWKTDEGIIAEGKRRGIPPGKGEPMQAYKQRLFNTRGEVQA